MLEVDRKNIWCLFLSTCMFFIWSSISLPWCSLAPSISPQSILLLLHTFWPVDTIKALHSYKKWAKWDSPNRKGCISLINRHVSMWTENWVGMLMLCFSSLLYDTLLHACNGTWDMILLLVQFLGPTLGVWANLIFLEPVFTQLSWRQALIIWTIILSHIVPAKDW